MLRGYHSLPKAGTEYTPQWMKIPNLASWYQAGTSNVASESHSGRNGPRAATSLTSATFFAMPGSAAGAEAAVKVRSIATGSFMSVTSRRILARGHVPRADGPQLAAI